MMKDIAHTAVVMVRQGKTLRGALAAKTRMLNSRLAAHRAVINTEQKAADKAARRAAGEPVTDSEPESPLAERQERERQERERQDRQLQRAERHAAMVQKARGRAGRAARGRGGRRGRGGGHGALYEEDPAARRARVGAHAPKEADIKGDENALLSFGSKVKAGAAGGIFGLMAPWGGLANGANAEGVPFAWGRPIVGAIQGPAQAMAPGAYAESLKRFAAGAGARVSALIQSLWAPQLKSLEPAAALAAAQAKKAAAAKAKAPAGGGGGGAAAAAAPAGGAAAGGGGG
jgi:hypothetical protein